MADRAAPFRAVYEHDPVGDAWLVRIEGLDGCHTYGSENINETGLYRESG